MNNRVRKKVRLKDKINQMVIFDGGLKYMYADIIQVYENNKGVRTGQLKATKFPVLFDKQTSTWSEVFPDVRQAG